VSVLEGTALVTGATGGLGQTIARALAARGATLVLAGRRADVLESLAAETGGRAVRCDLAVRADVERLAAEAGDVDLLVNSAGLPASGRVDDYELEQIDRALDVNLRAPIVLAKLVGEGMARRGRGHLVFISSLSGKTASGGAALYAATKFGLRGFATALREDLRSTGVGVSTIFPGFIRDAGMFAEADVGELPRGAGTRTPADVASALISAVERNRAEVDVAPLGLRIGATLGGLAPEAAHVVSRRLGSADVAARFAAGQRGKR
jgi:short-subunit dehydrogenase